LFCISVSIYACGANIDSLAYANKDDEKFEDILRKFSLNSAATIFTDSLNKNKNLCYSPASLYIAFALASAGAASQTQSEMFGVLGLTGRDTKYISGQIDMLLKKMYFKNRYGTIQIANSVWLKESAEVKNEFLENAENNYGSQVFNVNFNEIPATPLLMKNWVCENTDNLISPDFKYDPKLIFMYIINTLYFKDSWLDSFDERSTKIDLFHTADKQKVECEFMNKAILYSKHPYFEGNGFTASSLEFYNGGKMTFILPDENTDIYDLLSSPVTLDYVFDEANAKTGDVHFKVPKFKTQASFDLISALKHLGVEKAFIFGSADFSGITGEQIYISQVSQDTYIKIDEIGVEAAAMTQIMMRAGGGPDPDKRINIFLDRPFIYFITDKNGIILFEGVVFNPHEI
ncbi:MAG: hypothetical protein FWD23_12740, partial [Oscillospiraceae bacterium]|nr:hypothetical protein [Oscillospiraceae bacterium]